MLAINVERTLKQLILPKLSKMSGDASLASLKATAKITKDALTNLKNELCALNEDYNQLRAQQLLAENRKLEEAVQTAKQRLINLEVANGIKQIPIPNETTQNIVKTTTGNEAEKQESTPLENTKKKAKPAKVLKEKPTVVEDSIDIGRLDLRIAKIVEVQRHPDADTLYLLKVDAGEEKPRMVCSGLVKHIQMSDLDNRSVMLLCNLKPVKMRGIMSEAMVMCASSADNVEVLLPPNGSQPGDLVECEGYVRRPDPVMNPKKKIFETVAPDLSTNDSLLACYKGVPLNAAGKGFICAQTLKNVAVK